MEFRKSTCICGKPIASYKGWSMDCCLTKMFNWTDIFPNVPEAPRAEFTRLSTQVLSGHGQFVTHLHRVGKSDTENCPTCGTPDDPQMIHRILECPTFDAERVELRVALGGIPDLERILHIPLELLHGFAREPEASPPRITQDENPVNNRQIKDGRAHQ
jgi:hypothetical protein